MRKNKVGSIFLVSMLALAGLGISYAGFTDIINVSGTVNTATVELEVVGYSCTYVWKIWNVPVEFPNPFPNDPHFEWKPADEIAIYSGPCIPGANWEEFFGTNPGFDYELVSWAKAEVGATNKDVKMTFHNLFPCIDFKADFIVHYIGSIPAKVNVAEWLTYDQDLYDLYLAGGVTVVAYKMESTPGGGLIHTDEVVDIGYQLHNCDYVNVHLILHLPQHNDWQGLGIGADGPLTFTAKVGVIQWYDPCIPPE